MSDLLELEFEKINLDPCKSKDILKCDCKKSIAKQIEHSNTGSSLKVKERKERKNLIKPARLKVIGINWTRKPRNSFQNEASNRETSATVTAGDLDTFTSDAFLKMRITPQETLTNASPSPSEDKASQSSQPNSCSAQAKLQQQFSSSEFDSTIDEMSEILGYHLRVQDKNYLVNSMYT